MQQDHRSLNIRQSKMNKTAVVSKTVPWSNTAPSADEEGGKDEDELLGLAG